MTKYVMPLLMILAGGFSFYNPEAKTKFGNDPMLNFSIGGLFLFIGLVYLFNHLQDDLEKR